MKLHRAVWILVALHFVLALIYAWITPYREGGVLIHQGRAYAVDTGAPDERQHVNYVRHLASGAGFPIFNPKDPNLYESYQSHQPPLFYVVASTATLMHQPFSGPRSEGLEPYFNDAATGRFLRVLNALIGSFGVLGIYFFVLWGFRSQSAALAAAAFGALLPMNVALSGAVSNDPLLFCLCSWTLAWTARGLRDGWTLKVALVTGILMALAFLTKTTAIALWPAVALAAFMASRSPSDPAIETRQSKTGNLAILLVLPLAFAAPWWLRNMNLYGDPFAMKAFTDAFQGSPQASVFIQAGGALDYWVTGEATGTGVLWWTLRSFFGVFGYMDIFLPTGVYVALALLILALVVARVVRGRAAIETDRSDLSNRPKSKPQTPNPKPQTPPSTAVSIMGGIFFFLVLALFLRFNAQYFQGQARYILPAIAPISATLGIGAVAMFRGKGPWVIAGIFLALNAYVFSILPEEFRIRVEGAPRTSGTSRAPGVVVSRVHASKSEVSWL